MTSMKDQTEKENYILARDLNLVLVQGEKRGGDFIQYPLERNKKTLLHIRVSTTSNPKRDIYMD